MKIKPEIKDDIRKFLREKLEQKQKEITLVAPYKLSEEELREIVGLYPQLAGKKIKTTVDETLLAGVVLKQGTKVIDLSLASKIKNLQHQVNEAA